MSSNLCRCKWSVVCLAVWTPTSWHAGRGRSEEYDGKCLLRPDRTRLPAH